MSGTSDLVSVNPSQCIRSIVIEDDFTFKKQDILSEDDIKRENVAKLSLWPLQAKVAGEAEAEMEVEPTGEPENVSSNAVQKTGKELRDEAIEGIHKAAGEFQQFLGLLQQVKTGTYLRLESCPSRKVIQEGEFDLPSEQRVARMRNDLTQAQNVLQSRLSEARVAVNARRRFAEHVKHLRRHWRLLVLPPGASAGGQTAAALGKSSFSVGDTVAVDCGMSARGDSHSSAVDGIALVSLHMGADGAQLGPREASCRLCRLEASLESRVGGGRLACAVLPLSVSDGTVLAASVDGEVAVLHRALLQRRRHVMSARLLDYITHSAVQYQDSHISWAGAGVTVGKVGAGGGGSGVVAEPNDDALLGETLVGDTCVMLLNKHAVGVAFSDSYVLCFRMVPYQASDDAETDNEVGGEGGFGAEWLQSALLSTLQELQKELLSHFTKSVGAGIEMEHGEARALAPLLPTGEWSEGSARGVCALRGIADARGGRAGMVGIAQAHLRMLWQMRCLQHACLDRNGGGGVLESAVHFCRVPHVDTRGGVLLGTAGNIQVMAATSGAYEVMQSGGVVCRTRSVAALVAALRCRVLLVHLLQRLNEDDSGCVAEQGLGTSIVATALKNGERSDHGNTLTVGLTAVDEAGSATISGYVHVVGHGAPVHVSADWIEQASFAELQGKALGE